MYNLLMPPIFQLHKKSIDQFLKTFLASKQNDFARVNPWGPDALAKIRSVISEGKTIRGSLVLLSHDALHGKAKDDAFRVAAAYELIQTGLIIHDDIMDHDSLRRGKPTLHVQYKSEALAMCVGDILFFLAHELLGTLLSPKDADTALQTASNRIFEEVGIAQMQDVSFGTSQKVPAKEEILSLYKYKTARYTFSLPMMAGAILARADQKTVDLLEKLGEEIGILFQIQDDVIGLGDSRVTGKSAGSDIREDKKTLARFYAVQPEVDARRTAAEKYLTALGKTFDTTTLKELLVFVTKRNH